MKFVKIALFFIFTALFFISCNKNNENNNQKVTTDTLNPIPSVVKIENKVFGVPSPFQISNIIKDKNIDYNPELLNPTENYSKYLTSFEKSTNLGIYTTDLAYILFYDQLSFSSEYFDIVKKLSQDLGLLNSLQKETLDKIEENNNNKDSLISIISMIFRDIDQYLLESNQKKLSVLIITGSWVESVYFLTQILKDVNDKELKDLLASQKKPLNNIVSLIQNYYNSQNEEIKQLTDYLLELSVIYDGVSEKTIIKHIKTKPEQKLTIVESSTQYEINQKQIEQITKKIEQIRNWLIR